MVLAIEKAVKQRFDKSYNVNAQQKAVINY